MSSILENTETSFAVDKELNTFYISFFVDSTSAGTETRTPSLASNQKCASLGSGGDIGFREVVISLECSVHDRIKPKANCLFIFSFVNYP